MSARENSPTGGFVISVNLTIDSSVVSLIILFYNKKLEKSIYHKRRSCDIIMADENMFDILELLFYNLA